MQKFKQSHFLKSACWVLIFSFCTQTALYAQTIKPLSVRNGKQEDFQKLNFPNAPIDQVLDRYSNITGKTIIKDPGVPNVTINFKTYSRLSETDILIAIETLLSMNNISLVPMGDEFIKVIQAPTTTTHAPGIIMPNVETDLSESDNIISMIIELKHTGIQDVQPILQTMIHPYGKLQPLQSANAIQITDTEATIREMKKLLKYIDRPFVVREEMRIYEIQYAKASEIATRLNELVNQSQQAQQAAGRSTASSATRRTVSSLRSRLGGQPPAAGGAGDSEFAKKGLIQGNVQIISDERTNILIVNSDPVNFEFFDRIVSVLDRPVDPEMTVKVFLLEFAEAKEIAGVLNELIGAATSESDVAGTARTGPGDPDQSRSQSIRDFIRRTQNTTQQSSGAGGDSSTTSGSLNELSENTKILAEERTNSLLIMGQNEDIAILEQVIRELDVMLAQVLIQAVILEVKLTDKIEYGFDWLQRSLTVVDQQNRGPRGGVSVNDPVYSFGGGQNLLGLSFKDGSQVDRSTSLTKGALTYYATFFDLNVDAIVRMAASTTDAKILSSPVLLTTDNQDGKIVIGEQRPIPSTSSTTASGIIRSTYEYRDIGIQLEITPRINPKGFVILEITQSADNVGGNVVIDGNEVPIITRREMSATIGVNNKTTIVLGGMVSEDASDTITKVPVLGDIPIIGNLFRSTKKENNRNEILILLTPHVLMSAEDAIVETKRLKDATQMGNHSWYRAWEQPKVEKSKNARVPLIDLEKEEGRKAIPLFDSNRQSDSEHIPGYPDEFDRPVVWRSAKEVEESEPLPSDVEYKPLDENIPEEPETEQEDLFDTPPLTQAKPPTSPKRPAMKDPPAKEKPEDEKLLEEMEALISRSLKNEKTDKNAKQKQGRNQNTPDKTLNVYNPVIMQQKRLTPPATPENTKRKIAQKSLPPQPKTMEADSLLNFQSKQTKESENGNGLAMPPLPPLD